MLNDRQKKVLKTYEKNDGEIEIGDVEGIDEKKDFSSKDFTLALAKLNPFYVMFFNFKCFTKEYATKIVEAAKVFFVNKFNDDFYKIPGSDIFDIERYHEDWEAFSDMVKEKTAMRAAWATDRKKVDAKYEKKGRNFGK